MKYNLGEPGGPSGPFWSIVREDGMVIALQIPTFKLARRIADLLEAADALNVQNPADLGPRVRALREAGDELLGVADLRGDADLPHPADDPNLWTARMQTAWDEFRAALAPFKEVK